MSGGKIPPDTQTSKGKGRATIEGNKEEEQVEEDELEGVALDYTEYDDLVPYLWSGEGHTSSAVDARQSRSFDSYVQDAQSKQQQQERLQFELPQSQVSEEEGAEILRIMMSREEALQLANVTVANTETNKQEQQQQQQQQQQQRSGPSTLPYYQANLLPDTSDVLLQSPVDIPSRNNYDPESANFSELFMPWFTSPAQQDYSLNTSTNIPTESPLYLRSSSGSSLPSYTSTHSISPMESATTSITNSITTNSQAYIDNAFASSSSTSFQVPFHPSSSSSSSSHSLSHATTSSSSSLPKRDPTSRPQSAGATESETTIPACDICRRRKVKCDRQQPVCGFCARLKLPCTTRDTLRKRGPPTRGKRIAMRAAGFIYDRSRRQWRAIREDESIDVDESLEQDSEDATTTAATSTTTAATSTTTTARQQQQQQQQQQQETYLSPSSKSSQSDKQ